jgi:hypothetical protein
MMAGERKFLSDAVAGLFGRRVPIRPDLVVKDLTYRLIKIAVGLETRSREARKHA